MLWRCALRSCALPMLVIPALSLAQSTSTSSGQAYPSKPIRLVVGVPAGGTNDVVARLVGQKLSAQLGQQIIVDNRAGANGNIGAELVAKSLADGYTLFMASIGVSSIHPSLYSKMPFDTLRDFAMISQLTSIAQIIVVHPSVPAKDVKQLIAYAKAKPGQLTFAGGMGSSAHLAGELFKSMAHVDMLHVPYKGSAPAMTDLLGGQVAIMFDQIVTSLPHVRSGKLRALAVTTLMRSTVTPEIPTVSESALPGYTITTWHGLIAPAATPRDIVNRLSSETARTLESAEIKEKFLALGAEPTPSTPEQFRAFIKSETDKWAKVVKAAGLKPE
ncbi:MAG: Bug family tripartite tricarboxylate transporter substrate binding protein [Burkholderiales bacterium]